jgi:hypothetical protein
LQSYNLATQSTIQSIVPLSFLGIRIPATNQKTILTPCFLSRITTPGLLHLFLATVRHF